MSCKTRGASALSCSSSGRSDGRSSDSSKSPRSQRLSRSRSASVKSGTLVTAFSCTETTRFGLASIVAAAVDDPSLARRGRIGGSSIDSDSRAPSATTLGSSTKRGAATTAPEGGGGGRLTSPAAVRVATGPDPPGGRKRSVNGPILIGLP
jgi:hypothetical protein